MTRLEKWLEEAPEANYFRELRAVLDQMPIDFDIQARGQMNAAFQKAAETAMGAEPSEDNLI